MSAGLWDVTELLVLLGVVLAMWWALAPWEKR
jgi:hypothetical protein